MADQSSRLALRRFPYLLDKAESRPDFRAASVDASHPGPSQSLQRARGAHKCFEQDTKATTHLRAYVRPAVSVSANKVFGLLCQQPAMAVTAGIRRSRTYDICGELMSAWPLVTRSRPPSNARPGCSQKNEPGTQIRTQGGRTECEISPSDASAPLLQARAALQQL